MKAGAIIAIVVGVVAVIFLAVNRGLVSSGVSVGVGPGGSTSVRGIVAPQPSQNYGGYLAATTAPGISSALNGALMGLGSAFASWMGKPSTQAPVAQGASVSSPSLYAQPIGVTSTEMPLSGSLVGPQPATLSGLQLTYDSGSSGAAFDYAGLAADNAYDPSASLSYA